MLAFSWSKSLVFHVDKNDKKGWAKGQTSFPKRQATFCAMWIGFVDRKKRLCFVTRKLPFLGGTFQVWRGAGDEKTPCTACAMYVPGTVSNTSTGGLSVFGLAFATANSKTCCANCSFYCCAVWATWYMSSVHLHVCRSDVGACATVATSVLAVCYHTHLENTSLKNTFFFWNARNSPEAICIYIYTYTKTVGRCGGPIFTYIYIF